MVEILVRAFVCRQCTTDALPPHTEAPMKIASIKKASARGMKVRTSVKAGGLTVQHNRKVGRVKVRTSVKAGGIASQHNRKVSRVVVRTGVKAGGVNPHQKR